MLVKGVTRRIRTRGLSTGDETGEDEEKEDNENKRRKDDDEEGNEDKTQRKRRRRRRDDDEEEEKKKQWRRLGIAIVMMRMDRKSGESNCGTDLGKYA